MENFYNKTLCKLENKIKELEVDGDNPLQQIEAIISEIVKCLFEVTTIRKFKIKSA